MNQDEANLIAGENLKEFMEAQTASEELVREFREFANNFVERILADEVDEKLPHTLFA